MAFRDRLAALKARQQIQAGLVGLPEKKVNPFFARGDRPQIEIQPVGAPRFPTPRDRALSQRPPRPPRRMPEPVVIPKRAIRTDQPTRTRMLISESPNEVMSRFSEPFVHKRLIGAVSGLITGGPTAAVSGFFSGGGSSRRPQFTGGDRGLGLGIAQPACQPGHVFRNGRCERTGLVARAQRIVGGGQEGTQADIFGEAVVGAFGVPGLVPAFESVPTLRCPAGTVLGRDDICYRKGSIPVQFRKWRPAPKPFISGGDRKCLLRADRLRKSKTSKRILRQLGMG